MTNTTTPQDALRAAIVSNMNLALRLEEMRNWKEHLATFDALVASQPLPTSAADDWQPEDLPEATYQTVGRHALSLFCGRYCMGKPELVSCAEAAFYWFNKVAAQPAQPARADVSDGELPPLPTPFMELNHDISPVVYDAWAEQLQTYARAAIAADRASSYHAARDNIEMNQKC